MNIFYVYIYDKLTKNGFKNTTSKNVIESKFKTILKKLILMFNN